MPSGSGLMRCKYSECGVRKWKERLHVVVHFRTKFPRN